MRLEPLAFIDISSGGSSDESRQQQPGECQQQHRQADGRASLIPPPPRGLRAAGAAESHEELHDGDRLKQKLESFTQV